MNSNVTIILTIFGRDEYTHRWLAFLNDDYLGSQIIIADGNESPKQVEHEVKSFPNLNIKHIWIKKDAGVQDFLVKLQKSINAAEGQYIIFADNDDFIDERTLIGNAKYLSKNQLSFAICESYRFKKYKAGIEFRKLDKMPIPHDLSDFEKVIKSVKVFPSDYIYYGIMGKELIASVFQTMTKYRLNYWIFMEFAITCVLSSHIKQKTLMKPFLFRDATNGGHASTLVDKEAFIDLVFEENFHSAFKSLINTVCDALKISDLHHKTQFETAMKNEINHRIMRRFISKHNMLPKVVIKFLGLVHLFQQRKLKFRSKTVVGNMRRVNKFLLAFK